MSNVSAKSLVAIAFAATLMANASPTANAQFGQPNPIIGDTGQQISGYKYCPFTGRWIIRTDKRQVRESYLDQNRNYVDPGSYERVDEYETDRFGSRWHITGYRWTSYGTPHGNLNRRRITNYGPGIDIDENENIAYSPGISHDENQSSLFGRVNTNPASMPSFSRTRTNQTRPAFNSNSLFNNTRSNSSTLRIGGSSSNRNPAPFGTLQGTGGMRIRSGR